MYLSSPKTFPLLFIVFLILLPTSPFFLPPPPSHPLTIPLHASRLRSALIFRWLRTNNGTDTAPLQSLPAPTLEDLATSAQESTALIRKKEPKPRRLKSKVTVTSPAALRRSLYSDPAAPLLLSDHIYSEPSYSPSVLRSLVARNPVLQLVRDRAVAGSVPGQRQAHDHAHLALSIEGGGMRGCVSSGIAAAIALLNLLPAFDSIHGASAGSIVGAYAVSQQMCVDVYTDVLPASKTRFLNKRKLYRALATTFVFSATAPADEDKLQHDGMNTTFVLADIMSNVTGVRPFNFGTFAENSKQQPLNVLTSCEDFQTRSWTSSDFDGDVQTSDPRSLNSSFFASLASSMIVPGIAGPPIALKRGEEEEKLFFDAFVFSPLPYRSAVYDSNATHVLCLRTKPNGAPVSTSPGVYDRRIAPAWFRRYGMTKMASWSRAGGMQHRYCEDIMTCDEGLGGRKVRIPQKEVVYGRSVSDVSDEERASYRDGVGWKSAYLCPLMVTSDVDEMSSLENDRTLVIENVREGFIEGYEVLKDVGGALEVKGWDARRLAELLFPFPAEGEDAEMWEEVVVVEGGLVGEGLESIYMKLKRKLGRKRRGKKRGGRGEGLSVLEKLLPATRKGRFEGLMASLADVDLAPPVS